MPTLTSEMVVVTTPARFGFELVDIFFGEVRVRPNQTRVERGDILRDLKTGALGEFVSRCGTELKLLPVKL